MTRRDENGIRELSASRQVVQRWFEVWEVEPGVHVIAEPFHIEEVRSYLIVGTDRAVLIDTGMGVGDIKAVVDAITLLPVTLINSHAHWDHVGGNWQFDDIWIHEAEAGDLERTRTPNELRKWFTPESLLGKLPEGVSPDGIEIQASHATTLLRGGESIDLGGRVLEIMHTPGHSPGGIVVIDRANQICFPTDVFYLGSLYASAPTTNVLDYRSSLASLEPVVATMRVAYPSHGATPIEPVVVADMRIAFDEIIAGREPDEFPNPHQALHRYGAFSILVPASYRGGEGSA